MGIVIYVPEDVSSVSGLLEIGTQMGSMISCVLGERGKEVLVVAECALELWETFFEDCAWLRLVVMNVGLEGRRRHRAIRCFRLKKLPQNAGLVGVACGK